MAAPTGTMKAIALTAHGAASRLEEHTVAIPTPGPHDLLVEVKAVSVNPVDIKKRGGFGKPDGTPVDGGAPLILGYDAAGVVRGVGAEVTLFKVGDEVFYAGGIHRPGTNAQYHCVDERIVGHKPASLDFAHAAAMPLVTLTAWEGIIEGFGLTIGHDYSKKSILVVAGAGGVGSIAIQVAKKLLNLRVIATASRPETREYCTKMGADHIIDHTKPLQPQLAEQGIFGVDYVMNCVDLDKTFDQLVAILKPLGKICMITYGDSSKIDVTKLMSKRGTLVTELMFVRPFGSDPEDMTEQHRILDRAAKLFDDGTFHCTLTSSVPFTVENLRNAHAGQESGRTIGKHVLTL